MKKIAFFILSIIILSSLFGYVVKGVNAEEPQEEEPQEEEPQEDEAPPLTVQIAVVPLEGDSVSPIQAYLYPDQFGVVDFAVAVTVGGIRSDPVVDIQYSIEVVRDNLVGDPYVDLEPYVLRAGVAPDPYPGRKVISNNGSAEIDKFWLRIVVNTTYNNYPAFLRIKGEVTEYLRMGGLESTREAYSSTLSAIIFAPEKIDTKDAIQVIGNYKKLAVDGKSWMNFTLKDPSNGKASQVDVEIKTPGDHMMEGTSAALKNGVAEYDFKPFDDMFRSWPETDPSATGGGWLKVEASFKNDQGVEMAYAEKTFQVVRPPVIIIHGIWSKAAEMEPIKKYLNDHGFTYVFAYDYEQDNKGDIKTIANVFSQYVTDVSNYLFRERVSWTQFDIVAHSAGGLVARVYIANSNPLLVRKLVTIATPHNGSMASNILCYWKRISGNIPYTTYSTIQGPTGPVQIATELKLTFEERMTYLAQDFRSLTGTDLFLGSYGIMVEQLSYPADVDVDSYVSGQLQLPDYLARSDVGPMAITGKDAGFFVNDLNTPQYDNTIIGKVKVLCIAGHLSDTLTDWYGQGFFNEENDGLVPVESATSFAKRIGAPWIVIEDTDHVGVKSLQITLTNVVHFLNDRDYVAGSVYSPANISAYDEEGRHTGPLSDGTVETQIPGSEYFTEKGASHIVIDGNGTYRFVYNAVAAGNATFSFVRQVAGEGLKIVSYDHLSLETGSTYTVTADSSTQEPKLGVDTNGDNTFESEISPTSFQIYDQNGNQPNPPFTLDPMLLLLIGAVIVVAVAALAFARRGKGRKANAPTYQQVMRPQNVPTPPMSPPQAQPVYYPPKPAPRAAFCPNCGTRLMTGQKFCPNCGANISINK